MAALSLQAGNSLLCQQQRLLWKISSMDPSLYERKLIKIHSRKSLICCSRNAFALDYIPEYKMKIARELEVMFGVEDYIPSKELGLKFGHLSITDLETDLQNSLNPSSRFRVAYQGVEGTSSESAAEKVYPNCEAIACEQSETAFNAVENWLVDRAVLPIENSLGGSIHQNHDLLLRHSLHIVGEVYLKLRHCLPANYAVALEDLRHVISHPQALAQCENTLTKMGVIGEAVEDTAGAAQSIFANKFQDAGAVASSKAAQIYGLNILAHKIQDDTINVTRFFMLARDPIVPSTDRPFKTSIVFSIKEGPGVLANALAVFSTRDINLTKIESRPLHKQPLLVTNGSVNGCTMYFDNLFYLDFEASMADQRSQNALRHLEEFAKFIRVLGSYPTYASST
ncbi:arogenate dehydratase/prephenate dehydratase 2, chloroplastic-like isoform X2 [Macadamia integrifolia]|uniref:arogenate dehydratase/prephenate dehydratase 2, chloroplastic-like isoform X2 n=1 Tax=Macadamia integrifolia TaxID=60698 RepID=UPI001C5295BF|nr:arogenate dehydratase/prephenate dehydratase 2, chloroplastic-like isoform X2 [Macadamia integrifolia]